MKSRIEVSDCGDGIVNGTPTEVCDDGATSWTTGNCAANCDGYNYYTWPISSSSMLGYGFEPMFCAGQGYATWSSRNTSSWIVSTQISGAGGYLYMHYLYGGVYPTGYVTFLSTSFFANSWAGCWRSATYSWTKASYPAYPGVTLTREHLEKLLYSPASCCGAAAGTCVNSGLSVLYQYQSISELWCAD